MLGLKVNENVVVVPARVWTAWTKWYGQSKAVKRRVIVYNKVGMDGVEGEEGSGNNLKLVMDGGYTVMELEIDKVFI